MSELMECPFCHRVNSYYEVNGHNDYISISTVVMEMG